MAAWVPPIGIPMPAFGITEVAPAFPSPWTAAVTDAYYVCPTCPAATNTSNPNGWPAKPRLTLPNPLTPVSGPVVVQLVGLYTTEHTTLIWNGTAANPIFLRGTSDAVRPTFTRKLSLIGNSSYVIYEYLNAEWVANGKIEYGPVTFIAYRHNSFKGDGIATGGVLGAGTGNYDTNNILIWDNQIFDCGDWQTSLDQDVHGVLTGAHSSDIWIVDNTIHHCSGNGMQLGGGNGSFPATTATKRNYVGRNHVYTTKQDGLWIKQGTDIIFSQNLVHSMRRDSPSSVSGCMGAQYGPEYVWYIFNRGYDSKNGINIQSTSGGFGTHGYAIGNVFTDIHDLTGTADFENANQPWGVCISNRGLTAFHTVNNTCADYDGGFYSAVTGTLRVVNNVFADRDVSRNAYDYYRDVVDGASTIQNNDFQNMRVKRGGAVYTTVASLQAAIPSQASGNLNVDPLFVSASDFHRQAASQLVDAGIVDAAYAEFFARYGRSIEVDYDAVPRPVGAAWDIGAYESIGLGAGTAQAILATSGTYVLTGSAATLTHTAGPTLIGFIHRA